MIRGAGDERDVDVLYVGGYGRSGSTVISRVLGASRDCVDVGELTHIWQRSFAQDEPCGCGQPFSRCPFWTEVVRAAFGGPDASRLEGIRALRRAVDRQKFIPLMARRGLSDAYDARADEYGETLLALYRAIRRVSGRRVVVDSSKQGSYGFLLRRTAGIAPRYLHLVRDSRAVAFSWQRQKSQRPDGAEYLAMDRYSPLLSAHRWNVYNLAFEGIRSAGATYMRCRYEDFVADPAGVTRSICTFAGIAYPDQLRLEEKVVDLPVSHTVSGNPMRFDRGATTIRADEEWRTGLRRRDRVVVGAATSPLLWRYGYALTLP